MFHDLKHRIYWDMINTYHDKGLPEGSDIITGQVTVARSGIPVQITATSTPLRGGVFIRKVANDGTIAYIGTSNSVSTSNGFQVKLNEPAWIEVNDLSALWFDTDSSGSKWSYMAF